MVWLTWHTMFCLWHSCDEIYLIRRISDLSREQMIFWEVWNEWKEL